MVNPVQADASSLDINEPIQQPICYDQDLHSRPVVGNVSYVYSKCDENIVISDILWKKGWKNCTMKVLTSVKQFYLTIKTFISRQLWLIIYESQVMNFMMQKLNTVSPKILTCDSWVVNIVTNNVTNTDTSEYWHFRKVAERADLNRLTVRLTRI